MGCQERKNKKELIRIVRSPEGDISIDTMNRMAYLKREKEDNGMAWNDAASAAFHEVINQQ